MNCGGARHRVSAVHGEFVAGDGWARLEQSKVENLIRDYFGDLREHLERIFTN